MPAVNRYYSSVAVDTTLSFSITNSDLTLTVGSTAGFPTSYPYTLALGYDLSNEELVTIIAASGTTLTVGTTVAGGANIAGRGVDGTNDQAHAAGEAVKHVISARDMTEAQAHIAAEADVHGLATAGPSGASGGTIVGTTASQTLTNKTITGGTINPTTLQQGGVPAVTTTGTQTLTNKTLTLPKVNEDVAVTATATELNVLDGITASTAELNILDGVTASAAEINILDGATLTTTELNYVDGVTSAIQTQFNNNIPVGVVNMWVGASAPAGGGWLLCQGQEISRTTYSALFGVIGTAYGVGDNSTTFNLPDLRGRIPMGAGTGRNVANNANLTARTLGAKISDDESVTLTSAQSGLPAHGHPGSTASDSGHAHTQSGREVAATGGGAPALIDPGFGVGVTTTGTGTANISVSIASVTAQNAASAHNNTQPSTVINFIIKH
jgi:microcystin-dependent protein